MSIQVKEGQRAFVKKVEDKGKIVIATLTTGRKDKQSEKFVNSYWSAKFVGKALDEARTLGEGDRIEIKSAIMTKERNEASGKYYDNLTVFEFEVIGKGQQQDFHPVDENDDLPF